FLLELLDLDSSRATKYPLSAVSWVWDASISGTAPANLPRAIRGEIDEVSGPAVGLRVYGHDWVLPVESADAVVALLRRRIGLVVPGSCPAALGGPPGAEGWDGHSRPPTCGSSAQVRRVTTVSSPGLTGKIW